MRLPSSIPVSVVIPTKNEAKNIAACLSALARFPEIFLLDSSSSDGTCEIAKEFNVEVINFQWDGRFPKKRNWALRNIEFSYRWILFIDADEVVDEAFCGELEQKLENTQFSGFWLNYSNYFMGQKLKHGVPQRKLACFQIGLGEYEHIEEDAWSSLDMEVHEHPVLQGPIGEIETPIDHRDFRGIARFLDRHIDYAKWEASRYVQLKKNVQGNAAFLTRRQLFKYNNIEKPWFAWFYFLYTYLAKLGFLDGRSGYQYASYKKWYFQTVRNMIKEKVENGLIDTAH